jgi:hypothetical protein
VKNTTENNDIFLPKFIYVEISSLLISEAFLQSQDLTEAAVLDAAPGRTKWAFMSHIGIWKITWQLWPPELTI